MTFSLQTHWVWDFWLADDGDVFHLFYLHAPKSLGDEHLRHRNAKIGHATSPDLRAWSDHGVVLEPGDVGSFDETATWTGSVLRGPDGLWRMFYTGSRFLGTTTNSNIQSIGVALSADLHTWEKSPGPIVSADPRWYETLGGSGWSEEAWRDPWVLPDGNGQGWHMLITARASNGDEADRGVIGHATSRDLATWDVKPPLSAPGAGFAHLEVPQLTRIGDRTLLLFSCDRAALAGARAGQDGGIWGMEVDAIGTPWDVAGATLISNDALYSGRVIQDRSGEWVMLAFANSTETGGFVGTLSEPIPVHWPASDSAPSLAIRVGQA